MTSLVVQCALALMMGLFVLYVFLEARSVRRSKRGGGIKLVALKEAAAPLSADRMPTVSVLLPIYNEKLVVEKLVDAVCALEYPADKLEILVLDDSTDETLDIAEAHIAQYSARGIPISHVRRKERIGYKAGNLSFGLMLARGDFIAIFDADCLPPPDFLQKVMPCFRDDKIGFLQTAIAYTNRTAYFLTRFQAMEAGHKEDVTTGLSQEGFMASLTGSSCVWRRRCIDAIGGVSAETVTEDVDMGYKAQLHDWKYVFLRDIVSRAELPETMAAFRVQRQRWARGLIHNAVRHAGEMLATPMPLMPRLHAVTLMFSSLLLACFYALLLLCLPIALLTDSLGLFFHCCCAAFLLAAAIWAWYNTAGQGVTGEEPVSIRRQAGRTLGYVMMFFPLSLYYFSAMVQVLAGIRGEFHCTPKGCGRRKMRHPPVNTVLLSLEILSLCYALAGLAISLEEKNYWVSLYAALAAGGFSMTLFFSWSDSRRSETMRHICITGATGALGSALALEYAAPGIQLTLHGRREEALRRLAEQCKSKGARVSVKKLDLRRRDALRQWTDELCANGLPDLVIANAGRNTNIGPVGKGEPVSEVEALVDVNLLATMALVDGLLPAMRKRGSGQIAIVSSLASYYGLPTTPAYCATKAALRTWGTSLRGWLHSEGIRINVVLPGYVSSPMCDAMPGPKPFLWQPERAAKVIRRGLKRDWARISFPFPLNLGIWGLSVLPACLAMPIARILGYGR